MPKKILLPVDGSEHARKAAALAGDLAEKYDSELILLHVIPVSYTHLTLPTIYSV